MKVGVDARSLLSSKPRGEGKSLLRLYREIARLRPDWEIVFFAQGSAQSAQSLDAIRTKIFDLLGFRLNTWENLGLPWQAWRERLDVLHCSSSSAPRYAPVPIVMTVHDVIPLVANDGWSGAETARFAKQLRYGLSSAHSVIAVSQHTKNDLLRLFQADPKKIRVVHWGIDLPAPVAAGEAAGTLAGAQIRKPFVMAFGGAARRKNTATTIAALAHAAKSRPDLQLVLIGVTGNQTRQDLAAQAAQSGLHNVIFLDYVSEAMLESIYAEAECLVYASLYEGFGLPVLEAMSRGVAVVTSNVSSLPEVAGDAAVLVDPQDNAAIAAAVLAVCNDPQLKHRLQQQGLARAQNFNWHTTALATVEALEAAAQA